MDVVLTGLLPGQVTLSGDGCFGASEDVPLIRLDSCRFLKCAYAYQCVQYRS